MLVLHVLRVCTNHCHFSGVHLHMVSHQFCSQRAVQGSGTQLHLCMAHSTLALLQHGAPRAASLAAAAAAAAAAPSTGAGVCVLRSAGSVLWLPKAAVQAAVLYNKALCEVQVQHSTQVRAVLCCVCS